MHEVGDAIAVLGVVDVAGDVHRCDELDVDRIHDLDEAIAAQHEASDAVHSDRDGVALERGAPTRIGSLGSRALRVGNQSSACARTTPSIVTNTAWMSLDGSAAQPSKLTRSGAILTPTTWPASGPGAIDVSERRARARCARARALLELTRRAPAGLVSN